MSEEQQAPDGDGPATPRKVWYKLPGGQPVEEGHKLAGTATGWCIDGDGSKGLGWRPMEELAGYRKQQAEVPTSRSPRFRKESSSQGRFPGKTP